MITRGRCLVVWVGATVAALATTWWSLGAVGPTARFDQLVASVAGVALAACATWAWLVCSVVVAGALRDPARATRRTPGVPAWAARVVLAACGVAALTTVPAHASYDVRPEAGPAPTSTLDGLPFPDRALGPAHAQRAVPMRPSAAGTVAVEPGDSLWRLAEALLEPGAADAEVAATTAALVDLNRDVLGPDPDLIQPGMRLRTPGS